MVTPIRNEEDYSKALTELQKLFMMPKGTKEFDRAEILEILIADYEEKNYFVDEPDPIKTIKYLMEEEGINQNELGRIIGDKSKASLILNKKRKLSLSMIRNLHITLKIPLETLVQDYPLAI